jgi:hypothetical protein
VALLKLVRRLEHRGADGGREAGRGGRLCGAEKGGGVDRERVLQGAVSPHLSASQQRDDRSVGRSIGPDRIGRLYNKPASLVPYNLALKTTACSLLTWASSSRLPALPRCRRLALAPPPRAAACVCAVCVCVCDEDKADECC